MIDLLLQRTADISTCGKYRYRLTRQWADGPLLTFVMLNPSTADDDIDDPTIRRCMAFARRENMGGICVVNLFAFRATKPKALDLADNPYGEGNYAALGDTLGEAPVIVAWGAHLRADNPGRAYCQRAKRAGVSLSCLGRTKMGSPRHPLYVRGDQSLEPYTAWL